MKLLEWARVLVNLDPGLTHLDYRSQLEVIAWAGGVIARLALRCAGPRVLVRDSDQLRLPFSRSRIVGGERAERAQALVLDIRG